MGGGGGRVSSRDTGMAGRSGRASGWGALGAGAGSGATASLRGGGTVVRTVSRGWVRPRRIPTQPDRRAGEARIAGSGGRVGPEHGVAADGEGARGRGWGRGAWSVSRETAPDRCREVAEPGGPRSKVAPPLLHGATALRAWTAARSWRRAPIGPVRSSLGPMSRGRRRTDYSGCSRASPGRHPPGRGPAVARTLMFHVKHPRASFRTVPPGSCPPASAPRWTDTGPGGPVHQRR